MSVFYSILSALLVVNIIVLVHELGHYYAARRLGVKVKIFSIGMGSELFGFTDKNETRWRVSALPIGGYVMMLGDGDVSSTTEDGKALESLSDEEKKETICFKSNWEKMLISFAGPLANYAYAFVVVVILGLTFGMPKYDPVIGNVASESAAAQAGFVAGDRVLTVDGSIVERFRDIVKAIGNSEKESFVFSIERNGQPLSLTLTPEIKETKRAFGRIKKTRVSGIEAREPIFERLSIVDSVRRAFAECVNATCDIIKALSMLFSGKKSIDDFGGIVHMTSVASDISKTGNIILLIIFSVTLSLNLGFFNLLPLPVLDGGKILICFIEQIANRKINQKLMENIMIGCALLLILFMFVTTVNDILRIEVVGNFFSRMFG